MPAHGKVHRLYKGEVENSLTHRPEGVRLKLYAAGNSIKVYDKHGQVLRVETTLNHPEAFRVYRTPAGQPLPAGNFRVRDGKRRPAVKSSPATRGALAAPAPPAGQPIQESNPTPYVTQSAKLPLDVPRLHSGVLLGFSRFSVRLPPFQLFFDPSRVLPAIQDSPDAGFFSFDIVINSKRKPRGEHAMVAQNSPVNTGVKP